MKVFRLKNINSSIFSLIFYKLLQFIEMNCIKRFSSAPISYIAQLRRISFKQYLHIGTNFSPSYPIMIFSALTFTLIYCALILYFIFNQPNGPCFTHIRGVVYILTFLYPLETILCFICLTGTIALSKKRCWKVTWILLFGPVLSGFGFGQVGLVQACVLQKRGILTVPGIFTSEAFLDTMVYLYISFLFLYFILIPAINILYKRLQQDLKSQIDKPSPNKNQKDEQSQEAQEISQGCRKCITVSYYFLNSMLFLSFSFVVLIKIFGPFFYTYLWLQTAVNYQNLTTSAQKFMFASLLLAYFGPIGIMLITLSVQSLVKLCRSKDKQESKDQDIKTQSVQSSKVRDTWRPTDPKLQLTQGINRNSLFQPTNVLQSSITKDFKLQKTVSYDIEIQQQNIEVSKSSSKSRKQPLL